MLKEESIPWVILGHSERRSIFKESEDHIAEKTVAALKNGLKVIFCVGEKLEEREADKTLEVVESQLDELRKAQVDWRCAVSLLLVDVLRSRSLSAGDNRFANTTDRTAATSSSRTSLSGPSVRLRG